MPGHQFARSLPLQFMRSADSLFIQVINRSLARSPWGTRTAPTYRTNRIRHSAFGIRHSARVPSATVRPVDHQGCRSPNCRELSSPRTQDDQPGDQSLDGSNLAEPDRNAAPPAPHSHEGNVKQKGVGRAPSPHDLHPIRSRGWLHTCPQRLVSTDPMSKSGPPLQGTVRSTSLGLPVVDGRRAARRHWNRADGRPSPGRHWPPSGCRTGRDCTRSCRCGPVHRVGVGR
jgi:hypothetical protein